jgi:hypothetical protein
MPDDIGSSAPSRNVHVLFVHGVGTHSRLSSLLQAYQTIRSNVRSPETPITDEDPLPGWKLENFDDTSNPPYLKLVARYQQQQPELPAAVYFYEVNYSALAGVVRKNHRVDITRLFVGFDMAVNLARHRLKTQPVDSDLAVADTTQLAKIIQRLSTIFLAATVPIVGLPSLFLRNYTQTFVTTYTRFFEDIATFALDKNGEDLISAHVDQTIQNIVCTDRFKEKDTFVIVAHSLGSVVAHNYLVRHWHSGQNHVPQKILTLGSPIGLVCWLWLFLDFPRFKFNIDNIEQPTYFCWTPTSPKASLTKIQWINVLNHLDPIATAFPLKFVHLSESKEKVKSALENGEVTHKFIKTGGIMSVTSAHTDYFDDKTGFLNILIRLLELTPRDPLEVATRPSMDHWIKTVKDLKCLQRFLWGFGILFILSYFSLVSWIYNSIYAFIVLPLYLWPRGAIELLAYFQKLFFGWPTKRSGILRLETLPWRDLSSFPYWLRCKVFPKRLNPDPITEKSSSLLKKIAMVIISFSPTMIAMLLPAAPIILLHQSLINSASVHLNTIVLISLLLSFFLYLIFFVASELVRTWLHLINLLAFTPSKTTQPQKS